MENILEAGVGTDGKALLCVEDFMTPKDGSGSTEVCAYGNLMRIFGCINLKKSFIQG